MLEVVTGTKEELQAAVELEAKKIADEEAALRALALTHWIIFLDFDGVLNYNDFFSRRIEGGDEFDRACVARLNRLVKTLDAVVVISSSWRHGRSLQELRQILEAHGFVGTIIDKTPKYVRNADPLSKREYGQRGDEIRAWLDALPEKTERFIVLDDNSDMRAVMTHFVQTPFYGGGLTDEKVEEVLRLAQRFS